MDFYPFGGERVITDLGINNSYKFTDKERDPETGCDYFGARYYCNPIGRFITPDWSAKPTTVPYANFGNPQSLNLYLYAKNNPTTFGDPDGHCETTCQIFKGIAIGTAKFVWNTSIPGMAVNQMAGAYHDFKIGPAAAHAEHVAQGKALLTGVAALSGNFDAQMQVGMSVANTWHGMSTTDKASAITQGTLTLGTAVVGGLAGSGSSTARGLSESGGIFSSETNAAGGTVWTTVGKINQNDVGTMVNSAMTGGASEINILTGVHGYADGTTEVEAQFFQADVAKFGDLDNVNVLDWDSVSSAQLQGMVNGPGTTIGAFCNSGACMASKIGGH